MKTSGARPASVARPAVHDRLGERADPTTKFEPVRATIELAVDERANVWMHDAGDGRSGIEGWSRCR